jgi:hypothetical protein
MCTSAADCPPERFVPGTGNPRNKCLAAWRVLPAADRNSSGRRRRRATCVEGDPSCDFDVDSASCTFKVGACIGVDPERDSSCAFAPVDAMRLSTMGASADSLTDMRNDQSLAAATQALRTQPLGRCTPYVPIRVELRHAADGSLHRGARTFVMRSEAGDRHDRDRMSLVCEPPPNG